MTLADDIARIQASMKPISKKRPRFRGMIYGESGVGKTTVAAEILQKIIPEGTGILYVDTSEGWVSLNNVPGLGEGVMYVPFTTIEDLEIMIQAIAAKHDVFAYIGGVIFDEASSMAEMDVDRLHEKRQLSDSSILVPEWPDYHAGLKRFRSMMAKLFDIPDLHVMLLAHVNVKKGSKGEIIRTFPKFPEKTAAKIKEPLQLVGYMTSGNKPSLEEGAPIYERLIQVYPTGKLDAKTRIPIPQVRVTAEELPQIIVDWINSGGPEITPASVQEEQTPLLDPDDKPDAIDPVTVADEMFALADSDIFEPITD